MTKIDESAAGARLEFSGGEWWRLWLGAMAASAAISFAASAQAQVAVGSTVAATWTGSANSNWTSNSNWAPGGPPTATATFPAVSNETVGFPAATTTIGQMVFTAPGYTLNVTSGNSGLVFTGLGILTGAGPFTDPANRPIVNISGSGDVVSFLNNSTGGLARFVIGSGGILDASVHAVPSNMTAGSIVNAGLVDLGNPDGLTVGNSLTVFGPYVGMGGTVHLNTFLGTDASPSDVLVINGSQPTIDGAAIATGTSLLRITNAGGPGALTTSDGILVVDATNGGTTAPGAFALAGVVRAGAFDYRLFRGGLDGVSSPNDWFLRSSFIIPVPPSTGPITVPPIFLPPTTGPITVPPFFVPPSTGPITVPPFFFVPPSILPQPAPPVPPSLLPALPPTTLPPTVPPSTGPIFVLPTDPPPSVLPPGLYPITGPELPTYGVVQPIARQMGLATLGTLHERVGDAAADAACLNATTDAITLITRAPPISDQNCRLAVWGRLFGQQIDNHYQAFADPRASGQIAGIQTGIDVWRGSLIPGHSDTAGFYFAYGNGNVNVDGLVTNAAATGYILQHTGSLNLNAYSFGGYWTHYGPSGWYIDAVLQGSFYQGDASTQFASLPANGTGFTSSLEAGYPIPLPWFGPRFVLEPEGQVIWQRVAFDDAFDGLGPVGLGTTSGATGRLGLRGKWTIDDSAGRVWQPYVLANVWRDWDGNATTMFGIDQVPLLEQATRLEFAGGLSAKIRPGLSLYAQAGYQIAVSGSTDGGRRDGVKGDFGAHYKW
jgi:outer membrane autotransporter protein